MNDTTAVIVYLMLEIVLVVFYLIAAWKLFAKAGRPGWYAIIPILNIFVFLKIVGRPLWWIILFFIPIVSIIIAFVLAVDLAKVFGRSTAFGIIMLGFLSIIGYPILAFGKSQYRSPNSSPTPPTGAIQASVQPIS